MEKMVKSKEDKRKLGLIEGWYKIEVPIYKLRETEQKIFFKTFPALIGKDKIEYICGLHFGTYPIRTSYIINQVGNEIETLNSFYILGEKRGKRYEKN